MSYSFMVLVLHVFGTGAGWTCHCASNSWHGDSLWPLHQKNYKKCSGELYDLGDHYVVVSRSVIGQEGIQYFLYF